MLPDRYTIRLATEADALPWQRWVQEPATLRWFPMQDAAEIADAARHIFNNVRYHAVLAAEFSGQPCGIGNLYLPPYRRAAHQCSLSLLVAPEHRGVGVGGTLLSGLIKIAKEAFHMEQLTLEVYEGNPAMSLYHRFGFIEYGFQSRALKIDERCIGKHLMLKWL